MQAPYMQMICTFRALEQCTISMDSYFLDSSIVTSRLSTDTPHIRRELCQNLSPLTRLTFPSLSEQIYCQQTLPRIIDNSAILHGLLYRTQ